MTVPCFPARKATATVWLSFSSQTSFLFSLSVLFLLLPVAFHKKSLISILIL